MTVARKLQIRPGMTVVLLGRPSGVDLEIPSECLVVSDPADAATAVARTWADRVDVLSSGRWRRRAGGGQVGSRNGTRELSARCPGEIGRRERCARCQEAGERAA